jgi:hypothetical protein
MAEEKQYTLRTYGADDGAARFYTGRLPDGRSGVIGVYHREIVLVRFAADGTLADVQTRPLKRGPEDKQALAWQQELGWQPGPIRVRRFMLPDQRIYVADYPPWAIVFRHDPYVYPTPEERAQVRERVREWEENGWFVFWWDRDYYLDADGNVLST